VVCYVQDRKNEFYTLKKNPIVLARAVNGPCVNDVDCGDLGQCLNRKCQCQPGRRQEQVHDSIGREIIRCINGNMMFEKFWFVV
jgi:hypothetical protein